MVVRVEVATTPFKSGYALDNIYGCLNDAAQRDSSQEKNDAGQTASRGARHVAWPQSPRGGGWASGPAASTLGYDRIRLPMYSKAYILSLGRGRAKKSAMQGGRNH